MGKEEIARNEQFLLFPQCFFYSIRKLYPHFFNLFDIVSLFAAELEELKIGMCGKGFSDFLSVNFLHIHRSCNLTSYLVVRQNGNKINPFPKKQILDPSKLKEFADDNFKFHENGMKFSQWVENTVGKEEIAH